MPKAKFYEFTKRMMLTEDGKAVPAGHKDGVVLFGTPGKRIPHAQAAKAGLVQADDADFPKHTGGGWYELSNGDKVQGKADAQAAEKALAPAADKAAAKGEDKGAK